MKVALIHPGFRYQIVTVSKEAPYIAQGENWFKHTGGTSIVEGERMPIYCSIPERPWSIR